MSRGAPASFSQRNHRPHDFRNLRRRTQFAKDSLLPAFALEILHLQPGPGPETAVTVLENPPADASHNTGTPQAILSLCRYWYLKPHLEPAGWAQLELGAAGRAQPRLRGQMPRECGIRLGIAK